MNVVGLAYHCLISFLSRAAEKNCRLFIHIMTAAFIVGSFRLLRPIDKPAILSLISGSWLVVRCIMLYGNVTEAVASERDSE